MAMAGEDVDHIGGHRAPSWGLSNRTRVCTHVSAACIPALAVALPPFLRTAIHRMARACPSSTGCNAMFKRNVTAPATHDNLVLGLRWCKYLVVTGSPAFNHSPGSSLMTVFQSFPCAIREAMDNSSWNAYKAPCSVGGCSPARPGLPTGLFGTPSTLSQALWHRKPAEQNPQAVIK